MNRERGFDITNPSVKMIKLVEEVGELAKEVGKTIGVKPDRVDVKKDIEGELADVQIVLLGLASTLSVDMAEAVEGKETKNRKRTWK